MLVKARLPAESASRQRKRVSYSGYYATLPRSRYGFDSRYSLTKEFLLWKSWQKQPALPGCFSGLLLVRQKYFLWKDIERFYSFFILKNWSKKNARFGKSKTGKILTSKNHQITCASECQPIRNGYQIHWHGNASAIRGCPGLCLRTRCNGYDFCPSTEREEKQRKAF